MAVVRKGNAMQMSILMLHGNTRQENDLDPGAIVDMNIALASPRLEKINTSYQVSVTRYPLPTGLVNYCTHQESTPYTYCQSDGDAI